MKVLHTILAVCAAALLFAGCTKDKVSGKNYVTLGDTTIELSAARCTEADHGGFQAINIDFDGNKDDFYIHGFPRIGTECVGKTIDLSTFNSTVNYTLEINVDGGAWPGLYNLKDQGNQACWTETDRYGDGTIFKKGTMKLTKEKSGDYHLVIDGTLVDGRVYKWDLVAEYLDPSQF